MFLDTLRSMLRAPLIRWLAPSPHPQASLLKSQSLEVRTSASQITTDTFPSTLPLTTLALLLMMVGPGQTLATAQKPTAEPLSAWSEHTVSIEKNIVYAEVDGIKLLCDVYIPQSPLKENPQPPQPDDPQSPSIAPATSSVRPAVIVVHGGAWRSGDKLAISPYARALAQAGIVAVSINYRLAPKHQFPCQVDDVRLALLWLAENSDKYQIAKQKIGLMGYSAGAHLSCLLGTLVDAPWETLCQTTAWSQEDPRWEKLPKIRAVVGGGTPCEFRGLPPETEIFTYFLGGTPTQKPEAYVAASPTFHASPGDAPTLLIHGTRDLLVPLKSSQLLHDALLGAGVACELVTLEGPGHMLTFLHPETKRSAVEFLCNRLGMTDRPSEQASH